MIQTSDKCPGSTDATPHNLVIVDDNSGNKICIRPDCYFIIQHKDGTGFWQYGFDPATATSFVKEKADKTMVDFE